MRTAHRLRRAALLSVPVVLPVSMTFVFGSLVGRLGSRRGYNAGFAVYWVGWCGLVPLALVPPRRLWRRLGSGRRPGIVEMIGLAVPVAGALMVELLPNRRQIDGKVAAVMAGSALVNAVGEEALWRAAFLDAFPDDPWRGAVWPLAGFVVWHLAPQTVVPSRMGRIRFLLGSLMVGAGATLAAWRGGGLKWVIVAHIATDACGVTAARFRLGRDET